MRKGAGRADLREYNERTIIHALRRFGPASQAQLAERTGLSVPAVSSIVRRLAAEGYLHEVRSEASGVGRPRAIVDIVRDAAYSIGVHIDPSRVTAVLLDLGGTAVAGRHSADVRPRDPAGTLDLAAELVAEVSSTLADPDLITGAGLAVPGRIDPEQGAIVDSVWLPGWNGTPLREGLGRRIGHEVRFLKDTHAAVTGELWVRGRDLLEGTVVYVYLGIGTGFGIAVDGDVVTGLSGNAGQVGRIFEALGPGSPATSAGTEAAAPLGPTAQDPVALVAAAHEHGILTGEPPEPGDLLAIDRAFRSVCRSDAAEPLLAGAADRVAQAAAIAASLLDAQVVVFGGPYEELVGRRYRARTREVLTSGDPAGVPPVTLLASALGADAGAIGAASAVWDAQLVPRAPADRAWRPRTR